ncbi:Bro-N domain-containing protein [uncultured Acinetobacter sp.]|uniref:BRO-N domain-containing protein n=1 Tax=uncultured Acinetobacter sp. TaxID=165433 RepID=UPI0025904AC6|nr:Bro-N domain-containing protein [uncultured Acinetobacter sp.]
MTSLALTFHETTFNMVDFDQQVWITSRELGQALGYARDDAVNKIYERNFDEFSHQMTRNVKLTLQGQQREVRAFSLRGSHLIAMFAKTAVAKEFRKWVLDILDREVQQPKQHHLETRIKINNRQIAELKAIVDRRCEGGVKKRTEMWHRHHQHFKVSSYKDLLAIHFQDAVNFLETMKLRSIEEEANIRNLVLHMVWLSQWWDQFGNAIRQINPKMGYSIHEHFKNGAYEARLLLGERSYATLCQIAQNHDWQNESLDLHGIIGRLISTDAKYSNLLSLNKLDQ